MMLVVPAEVAASWAGAALQDQEVLSALLPRRSPQPLQARAAAPLPTQPNCACCQGNQSCRRRWRLGAKALSRGGGLRRRGRPSAAQCWPFLPIQQRAIGPNRGGRANISCCTNPGGGGGGDAQAHLCITAMTPSCRRPRSANSGGGPGSGSGFSGSSTISPFSGGRALAAAAACRRCRSAWGSALCTAAAGTAW